MTTIAAAARRVCGGVVVPGTILPMSPTNTRIQLRRLATALTLAPGAEGVLRRVLERALELTDADAAFIERAGGGEWEVEVVASAGTGAPAVGASPPYLIPRAVAQERITLVGPDGTARGALVLLRETSGAPASTGELDPGVQLLLDVAVDALEVRALVAELDERRRALEDALDERFRLISGITYELRETLGAASEYVQLLDTEQELTPRQREYIESSRRTISAGLRLIGDLLELARVEAGRLPVQLEPTSVGALLRDMARDYQLASATYGVHVDIDVPRDLPLVVTDPDLVGQILDTLLSNAVRYTPPNGTIRVRASIQPGRRAGDPRRWLRATITDTGPGVDSSYDVFEAVERVSSGRGAPGFRLAISRNVARLLGGDLTLEREPGTGASFSLWLPLSD
ncbi:MAG: HAMP domain-containing histidine kinase [Candidatus Cloacimonetes bacterium]|nr:HAMP domain-containing histidine kinase [Candidatus Cloacimonadota bacterium]